MVSPAIGQSFLSLLHENSTPFQRIITSRAGYMRDDPRPVETALRTVGTSYGQGG
jgi:hypothetical protein